MDSSYCFANFALHLKKKKKVFLEYKYNFMDFLQSFMQVRYMKNFYIATYS